MTLRNIVLIVVALLVAGGTALFAKSWVSAEKAALKAQVRVEKVVARSAMVLVAAEALPAGSFVKPEHLRWQPWPEDGLGEVYVVQGKRRENEFIGAVARTTIPAGSPILDSQLVHPGQRGFLAAVLTPGMRAVSVPVNATSGISGFIFPGDRVDLLLTLKFEREDGLGAKTVRYATRTLLTDVRVLAIDQRSENAEGEIKVGKTATVEVDASQAEKVALGLEMGSLSLALRSLARTDEPTVEEARAADSASYVLDNQVFHLIGAGQAKAGGSQVTVLRGGQSGKGAR